MTDKECNTIRELLFLQGQDPDHNAIECPGMQPLTYHGLREHVRSVVRILNAGGFHRNDRIVIVLPAGPEAAVLSIAVMAGFTALSLNPQSRQEEFQRIFQRVEVKAVIIRKGFTPAAEAAAHSIGIPVIRLVPDMVIAGKFTLEPGNAPEGNEPEFATGTDTVNILLTSGTTAEPKLVSTPQKNVCAGRKRQSDALRISPADRCLHIIPYYHGAGIGLPLLGVLSCGGTVICTREFIPSDFFSLLTTSHPTFYTAVPAIHQEIFRNLKKIPPEDLKDNSLRFLLSSASPLSADLSRDLESLLGVPVIEMYATSEAGTISINYPPKPGSVGLPVIDSIAILDENNNHLGRFARGEIAVQGNTVVTGYEGAAEETASVFRNGWYRTGDSGYIDGEGYLFLTGRIRELINKGGEKISPEEIDAAITRCAGVRDAMAFGIPDPVLGEDIAALVVLSDPAVSEPALRQELLDRLTPSKIPRRICFVEEIPRTPSGKPLRQDGLRRCPKSLSLP